MYNSFWNFTVQDITRNYIKQKSLSYDLQMNRGDVFIKIKTGKEFIYT